MTKLTVAKLAEQVDARISNMESMLQTLVEQRTQLDAEVTPALTESLSEGGIRIIREASKLDVEGLFSQAEKEVSFVTYGAVAQAMGLNHKFMPGCMGQVLAFIEKAEVDHLVVNGQGKYGAGAEESRQVFTQRLSDAGYTAMPEVGARRKRKAKKTAEVSKVEKISKLIELLDL